MSQCGSSFAMPIPDTTANYSGQLIEVTFTDDASWRLFIKEIALGEISGDFLRLYSRTYYISLLK